MENYMEKLKKVNGSGQCAFVLAIAEKILEHEDLKIESEVYNFAKKAIEVYWYWLNNEIILGFNDIYSTIGEDEVGEDFSNYCMELLYKYGHNNMYNKYALILSIFLILALHVQGKEIEYYNLDINVDGLGDHYIEDFIERILEQKIISEYELHLLLDYLNQKHSSYCEICRNDVIAAIKTKNEMFIEKEYELRNYRRINASGQCALVLVLAEKALNSEKLDKVENIYQFTEEKIACCWKWLHGEIKGKENIEKIICAEDENKNINLYDFWNEKDERGQFYSVMCHAIDITNEKALLPYDEYNYMEDTLYSIVDKSIKSDIITEKEYNNLIDYLDNAYPNYTAISKKEIMDLL